MLIFYHGPYDYQRVGFFFDSQTQDVKRHLFCCGEESDTEFKTICLFGQDKHWFRKSQSKYV